MPSGLVDRVAGGDAVADEDDAVDAGQVGYFGGLHDVVDTVQLAGLRAGEEVVEGEHGVGLAAAEVGLQLHDGFAALAVQALQSICQQAAQALGEVGAAEEFGRVAVFGGALAEMDLPEVGGEFGLLVVAAGDVGVGVDDVAPGGEAAGGGRGDGGRGAAALAAGLFFVAQAQQLTLHFFDFGRLLGGDGGQQALCGIQHANGVVAGERLLVRPRIAMLPQFAHETAFQLSQGQRKDVIPRYPHHAHQVGDIHVMERLGRFVVGEDASLVMGSVEDPLQFCFGPPFVASDELPRNVGPQTDLEEIQREADAFSIGGCHGLLSWGQLLGTVLAASLRK